MRAARSCLTTCFGCGVVKSFLTGTWVPLAPSRVGGPVRLDLEAARFGYPQGRAISATVWRKWLRLTLGSLRSPCGCWGIPSGWSSPLRCFFGDLRGLTFGSCWAACGLPAPFALGHRGGETPRWSGCWPSCCGSSSTRPSSSTPLTCRSPLGASASDEGLAFVGGWCSNKVEPEKKEVYWFHEQIHVEE